MQTPLKVFVILALAVTVSLGLYVLVDSQFTMSFSDGGMSPGFSWLLEMRAHENGGQIAPSFSEIAASGDLPPFMQGGAPGALAGTITGPRPAAISKGFEPAKAPGMAAKDISRLLVAALVAAVIEMGAMWFARRRREPAS